MITSHAQRMPRTTEYKRNIRRRPGQLPAHSPPKPAGAGRRLVPLLRSQRPTPLGRAAAFPPKAGPKAVRGPEWGWGGGEREAWRRPGGQEGKLRLSQCFPSLWTPQGVSQRKVFLIKVWEFLDFLDICL